MMRHQDQHHESSPILEDDVERPNYQSNRLNINSSASSSTTVDGSKQDPGNDNKDIDMDTLVACRLNGASLYSILIG